MIDPAPTDHVQFDALYSHCRADVYRTCLGILRNPDDASDATQEVFTRVLPLLSHLEQPEHWVARVARNYSIDLLRRRRSAADGNLKLLPGVGQDPEHEALVRHALACAFQQLSQRERRALQRFVIQGRTLHSVADDLGVSYSAAAKIVSRARQRAAAAASAVISAVAVLGRYAAGQSHSRQMPVRAAADVGRQAGGVTLAATVIGVAMVLVTHPPHAPAAGSARPPAAVHPGGRGAAGLMSVQAPGHAAPAPPGPVDVVKDGQPAPVAGGSPPSGASDSVPSPSASSCVTAATDVANTNAAAWWCGDLTGGGGGFQAGPDSTAAH